MNMIVNKMSASLSLLLANGHRNQAYYWINGFESIVNSDRNYIHDWMTVNMIYWHFEIHWNDCDIM